VLLDWASYFERVYEAMEILDAPKPPKKIYCDPEKFNRWLLWAKKWDRDKWAKQGSIVPFGEIIDDEDDYYGKYSGG